MAMRTMEVGVVTFSLTRKRRVRTEKLQMSTPEDPPQETRAHQYQQLQYVKIVH